MYHYVEISGLQFTEEQILEQIGDFYDFTIDCYNIVANDILKDKYWMNVSFEISPDKTFDDNLSVVFGSYRKGFITIYLYAIMSVVPRYYICSIIISVIVHELMHSIQVDMSKKDFKDRQEYINMVERPVEWETLKYLTEKREYLEDLLGVGLNVSAIKRHQMKYPIYNTNLYTETSAKDYWLSLLEGLYGKDSSILESLRSKDSLENNSTIVLCFTNDGDINDRYYNYGQHIKENGEFDYPYPSTLILIDNIVSAANFSFKTSTGRTKNDVYVIDTHYKIDYNPPLIKYDKPCTT